MIHLGKEPGTKAFRLFDPTTNTVNVSRDVVFEESKWWPWERDEQVQSTGMQTFAIANISGMQEPVDDENTANAPETEGTDIINEDSSEVEVSTDSSNEASSGTSSEQPSRYRSLTDVYENTEEVELEEELYLMNVDEPVDFNQAVKRKEWRDAMDREMEAVEKNKTWCLFELPPGQKAIGLKWIFKVKRDADGKVVKHKSRIVAKGYVQKHGIDFEEIFAHVARL